MLFDANIFTRSAPSAFILRTNARIASGVPVFSLTGRIDVSSRGPGTTPRAIAARRSTSDGEPMLCTVVKPAISVTYAFSAEYSIDCCGVSPWLVARPSLPKWVSMWTCVSIEPGSSVRPRRS